MLHSSHAPGHSGPDLSSFRLPDNVLGHTWCWTSSPVRLARSTAVAFRCIPSIAEEGGRSRADSQAGDSRRGNCWRCRRLHLAPLTPLLRSESVPDAQTVADAEQPNPQLGSDPLPGARSGRGRPCSSCGACKVPLHGHTPASPAPPPREPAVPTHPVSA
jgi:hypothetical protein